MKRKITIREYMRYAKWLKKGVVFNKEFFWMILDYKPKRK